MHVAESVQPSPARADAPEAESWLPVPKPESLPSVEELLAPRPEVATEMRDVPIAARGPGRAEPHDETAWLPLPEVEDLPSIQDLLDPNGDPDVAPTVGTAPAAREIPAEPSPARAAPADAAAWLPLPAIHELPEITELVDPDRGAGASPPPPTTHRRHRAPHPHLPRRSTLARLGVVVLVLATLTGLYFGGTWVLDAGDDVSVRVDGKVIDTETGVSTVASLLTEQKVELAQWDRVVPTLKTPVENGMAVKVVRAFPVSANVDGTEQILYSTYRDPQDFVRDAARQLAKKPKQIALLEPPQLIERDTAVNVRTKRVGTLIVDQSAVNYNAGAQTVGELLGVYGVLLGPQDLLELTISGKAASPDTELPDNETVEVTRVAQQTVTILEEYTLDAVPTRPDPELPVGETRVEEAVTGTRNVTWALEMHDGVEVGRKAISAVPVNPASPRVEYYGTKYNPLWDKMAQCETGGNWQAPGLKYQGGLGIYDMNWNHYGGLKFAPTAGQATKFEQIIVAERIRAEHGWRAWGCAKRIGL